MARRVQLPIAPASAKDGVAPLEISGATAGSDAAPRDQLQRGLTDLRISVTDRCNFRCGYCMPKEVYGPGFRFLPRPQILSFEEIASAARVFVDLGVRKLRLTGGEPLLRSQLPLLIKMLSPLNVDLALTTNGALLAPKARELADAGLSRITVSLDAIDDVTFRRMNDVDFPIDSVLDGIRAAQRAGLGVKVNCVVRKGVNDDQVVPLARHFKGSGITLRFIEFMDVGSTNGWDLTQVVSSDRIIRDISAISELRPIARAHESDVASRFEYVDGSGEVGVISSVTKPFCGDCTRARLSAEGKLYTCLFATQGYDLRSVLRGPNAEAELPRVVTGIWAKRADRYSEARSSAAGERAAAKIEMSYIGG